MFRKTTFHINFSTMYLVWYYILIALYHVVTMRCLQKDLLDFQKGMLTHLFFKIYFSNFSQQREKKLKIFSRLCRKNLYKKKDDIIYSSLDFLFHTTSGNCTSWIKMWKVFDVTSNQCCRLRWLSVQVWILFQYICGKW